MENFNFSLLGLVIFAAASIAFLVDYYPRLGRKSDRPKTTLRFYFNCGASGATVGQRDVGAMPHFC